MKKTYITPEMEIYKLPKQVLLAGSGEGNDDPDEFYDAEGSSTMY